MTPDVYPRIVDLLQLGLEGDAYLDYFEETRLQRMIERLSQSRS